MLRANTDGSERVSARLLTGPAGTSALIEQIQPLIPVFLQKLFAPKWASGRPGFSTSRSGC